jgi:integrase
MSGHVRQRGQKGQWYAVFDVVDPVTGKRKRRWQKLENCKGKRDAEKACERLIAQRDDGTYVEPHKTTIAEFLDRWLDHIRSAVAPRTHERYAEIARKNVAPLIGQVRLSDLKPIQISTAYTKALRDGTTGKGALSPRSVLHMHRVLKQALKQAVRWELLNRNPADAVDAPKVDRAPINTLDVPQTAALIDAVRGHRVFIPTLLAALCGLRRGEIAALRWRNVDLDKASLSIVQSAEQTRAGVRYKEPKSGRGRAVALSTTVIEELRAWRVQQAQEFLRLGIRPTEDTLICTTAAGEGIQPNSLTHEFLKAIAATALPRIRFHDLRHAHATHMLASGVHPKVASERLGHSKIGITLDLYSHVLPGMQADAVSRVDAAFKEAQRRA